MPDFSLYLITDSHAKNWLKKVEIAVKSGVTCVQYREKNLSFPEMFNIGGKILKMLQPYNVPLIINDYVDLAIALNADGVHIGQNDMDYLEVRRHLGKNKIIGLSIENISQAKRCAHLDVDYFGVGPIFPTKTKRDAAPIIGITALKQIRSIINQKIVAIGGIHEKNLAEVLNSKVEGIAISSALMHAKYPEKTTKKIASLITKYKNE